MVFVSFRNQHADIVMSIIGLHIHSPEYEQCGENANGENLQIERERLEPVDRLIV